MADVSLLDRAATRLAAIIDRASDDLAEILAGDPKLIKQLERKTFNQMTQSALEILQAEKGQDWVRDWLEGMRRK